MFMTIAVCTWNRAQLLDTTLREMTKLHIPEDVEWEILVVNNNCSDDTDAVIARHAEGLPIRRLFQPEQGLSHARNCAAEAARGELILWTDDDVLVDSEWLAVYADAAREYPKAAFFGGTVNPWFSTKPPAWLERNLSIFSDAYALRQYGDEPFELTTHERLPYGANMATRRAVFDSARFDTTLGRSGGDLISGEETQLFKLLLADGHVGIWAGRARVDHYIGPDRLTLGYLGSYFYGSGRSSIRHALADGRPGQVDRNGLALKHRRQRIKSWRHSFRRNEPWARAFCRSAKLKGKIDELREQNLAPLGSRQGLEAS
jgi:glycosyltransferase involved in cell wall biosynthesis